MSDLTPPNDCGYCIHGVYQPAEHDVPEVCPYCGGADAAVPLCLRFCSPDMGNCDEPARFVVAGSKMPVCEEHATSQAVEVYPVTPEALALRGSSE